MADAGNARSRAVRASIRLATSFEHADLAVGVVVSDAGGGVGVAWTVTGSSSSCEAGTRETGTRMAAVNGSEVSHRHTIGCDGDFRSPVTVFGCGNVRAHTVVCYTTNVPSEQHPRGKMEKI